MEKLGAKNLVVVEYNTKTADHGKLQEIKINSAMFPFDSCSRQIWITSEGNYNEVAEELGELQNIRVRKGKQAYRYLLEYYCGNRSISSTGCESEKLGETHIASQLKTAWKNYSAEHPEQASAMQEFWQDLTADMRKIRSEIASRLHPARLANAAQKLSEQQAGDKVLIIGDVANHGDCAEALTEQLALVLGNNRSGRVSEIMFTHPDNEGLKTISRTLIQARKEGKIAPNVKLTACDFKDEMLMLGMHYADAAFVTYPMEKAPDVDDKIISDWNASRINERAKLIHVRGTPKLKGMSSTKWESTDIHNFYSPESVHETKGAMIDHNRKASKEVRNACENCAVSRADFGKRPVYKLIDKEPDEYLAHSGLHRSGAMRSAG